MSTAKQSRHTMIRKVLRDERIDTHESMADALARRGIDVSQSTLSKDLRELGVVRVPQAEGGFRYWLADGAAPQPDPAVMQRELRDYVTDLDRAQQMLVVKTLPGHASVVSEAIDRLGWPEVIGTLAGENTIFVMARSAAEARTASARLATLTGRQPTEGDEETA